MSFWVGPMISNWDSGINLVKSMCQGKAMITTTLMYNYIKTNQTVLLYQHKISIFFLVQNLGCKIGVFLASLVQCFLTISLVWLNFCEDKVIPITEVQRKGSAKELQWMLFPSQRRPLLRVYIIGVTGWVHLDQQALDWLKHCSAELLCHHVHFMLSLHFFFAFLSIVVFIFLPFYFTFLSST